VVVTQPDLPALPVVASPAKKPGKRLKKGLLITFEGGEGTGKTTQATRLAGRLIELELDVHTAHEPGVTKLGEQIRTWVKRESDTSVIAETMLFAAARAQLAHDFLGPKMRRGLIVILDRFIDSTLAYQGYARGMSIEQIRAINQIAIGGLMPDLTVFLDADPKAGLDRVQMTPSLFDKSVASLSERRVDREDERRFENESLSFHQKVRHGYHELAKEGGRWCVIGAGQARHRVADAIWKRVRPLLVERGVDADLLVRKHGESS
jgi:dTMP kinase